MRIVRHLRQANRMGFCIVLSIYRRSLRQRRRQGGGDPLSHPVVQEVARLFNTKVVEVIATSDWPRRKAEILEEYQEQAKRKQETYQRPDFWTALYERRARFDPTKPVD